MPLHCNINSTGRLNLFKLKIPTRILIKGDNMGYSQQNSKGTTYFLHSREGRGGAKLYYFSKDPSDSVDLPSHLETMEGHTGMLMVKKKNSSK